MIPGIPSKEASRVMEMVPDAMAIAVFPAGAIAQAWLNEYSQQVSWDDLKRGCENVSASDDVRAPSVERARYYWQQGGTCQRL
jgi:hypothetical protein